MYCTSCGTKLPDNARFCSLCGTAVTQNQSSQQIPSFTPQQDEQIMQAIAEVLTAPVKDAVRQFSQLAEAGPVTNKVVEDAIKLRDELQKHSELHIPADSPLNYYALAHDIERFFTERWYSFFLQNKRGRGTHKVLQQDWDLYIPRGLDNLLSVYPKINRTQVDALEYRFKGLAAWLEDCIVVCALVSFGWVGIKLTQDELFMVTNMVGPARAGAIFDKVKAMRDMTR